jgi:hypothetical protein
MVVWVLMVGASFTGDIEITTDAVDEFEPIETVYEKESSPFSSLDGV